MDLMEVDIYDSTMGRTLFVGTLQDKINEVHE